MRGRALLILVLVLIAAPLLVVVLAPLHVPAPEWAYVRSSILPSHLWETAQLLVLTLLFALAFGVSTAWLVSTFEFPGRKLLRWALVLPLALPTYVSAITLAMLFSPTGSMSEVLVDLFGFRVDIISLSGLALVLALVLFPYVYLPTRAAFSSGMSMHLDAARMLGGGAVRRFFRVAMPMARPAIVGGAVLVAMETLNDYGAVRFYGVHTLTAGIFRSWGGLYDPGSALRLSGILLLIVLLFMVIERTMRRRAAHTTANHDVLRIQLHGWRSALATGWCTLLLAVAFFLPSGALLLDVFRTWNKLDLAGFSAALFNTLSIGGIAAVITLAIALLMAFVQRNGRQRSKLGQWTTVGYVVPGAVIAMGVMTCASAATDLTGVLLIGTITVLVFAFVVRFLALAAQPIHSGLDQQPRSFDEAARLLGASPMRTFLHVNLPLLRPAVIAAALLVLMEVVKELPLTLVLRPFNFETLSTRVFDMARIEQWPEAALPALLIVLCGLVPVLVLDRLLDRRIR